jgi:hypothetical protein
MKETWLLTRFGLLTPRVPGKGISIPVLFQGRVEIHTCQYPRFQEIFPPASHVNVRRLEVKFQRPVVVVHGPCMHSDTRVGQTPRAAMLSSYVSPAFFTAGSVQSHRISKLKGEAVASPQAKKPRKGRGRRQKQ